MKILQIIGVVFLALILLKIFAMIMHVAFAMAGIFIILGFILCIVGTMAAIRWFTR